MGLTAGTRVGAYEIVELVGQGGMGEVFRARDTKLGRNVALKVLPSHLAADPDRIARFQREAQVLASLNHPHIAAIYGLEEADGVRALVLELVEGETLADRIASGRIPLDEALPIARQIAEALEAAHEQGIIHRDLKPANIKLDRDGRVKVLDFGLAKLAEQPTAAASNPSTVSMSPTITTPAMTQMGMILGTAAYMSPEQAKGRPADKRSDVWAFGCVLYEMLTGKRAFDGEDVSETLASVLKGEPDWAAIPSSVPVHFRNLLRRALAKDRRSRIPDIAVIRFALDEQPPEQFPSHGGWKPWLAGAALLVVGVAAGAVLRGRLVSTPPPTFTSAEPVHTDIPVPATMALVGSGIAISPDGRMVAAIANDQLHVRQLDHDEITVLRGTSGARAPFFSPDSAWIGFVSGGELRKVRTDGTNIVTMCRPGRAPDLPLWTSQDTIVFSVRGGGLMRCAAVGGPVEVITEPNRGAGEITHTGAQLLPDGSVLFSIRTSAGGTAAILSLQTRKWRTLQSLPNASSEARYVSTGHLVYRGGTTLFAVPFDAQRGTIGSPTPVVDGVLAAAGNFSLSRDGTLVYLPVSVGSGDEGNITVVDRFGKPIRTFPNLVEVSTAGGIRFSPTGELFAVSQTGENRAGSHLWIYDVNRSLPVRLTSDGPVNSNPVWSPDGLQIVYNSTRTPPGVYAQRPKPGDNALLRLIRGSGAQIPTAWLRDGTVFFHTFDPRTAFDIWTLDAGDKASPAVKSAANELTARVSSNEKWMAYQSDASGTDEIYIRALRGSGETQPVSAGIAPRWAGNGELLYRRGRAVMSVTVEDSSGPLPRLGEPKVVFEADDYIEGYDVSPDGKRFVILQLAQRTKGGSIKVVQNWFTELQRLVPTK